MKRATVWAYAWCRLGSISIHALVKRATPSASGVSVEMWISIHALVKRATTQYRQCNHGFSYFNPRPREEGDLIKADQNEILTIFQSTPS